MKFAFAVSISFLLSLFCNLWFLVDLHGFFCLCLTFKWYFIDDTEIVISFLQWLQTAFPGFDSICKKWFQTQHDFRFVSFAECSVQLEADVPLALSAWSIASLNEEVRTFFIVRFGIASLWALSQWRTTYSLFCSNHSFTNFLKNQNPT